MVDDYLRQYGLVLILTAVGAGIPVGMLTLSWLLSLVRVRPHKPNEVKQSIYECGMETIGGRLGRFNIRYYLFAVLFVIFDVEVVFIYPWAVRFNQLGLFAFLEMLVFILVLVLGWLYAWRKRALEWE